MANSWIDFYNQLTAGSKAVSQTRKQNFFRLDYGLPAGGINRGKGGGSAASNSNKPWITKLADSPIMKGIHDASIGIPGIGSSLALTIDAFNSTEGTPGKRIIDLMSRPNNAAANYLDKLDDQTKGGKNLQPNLFDPEAIKAAFSGLTGQHKITSKDLYAKHGAENDDFGEGLRNFVTDMVIDPTSYIGPGLVKGALKTVKRGSNALVSDATKAQQAAQKAAEFTNEGTQVPAPRAVEGLTSPNATRPVTEKSFADFYKHILNNDEPSGPFDNLFDPRSFENKAPVPFEGPPLPVVAARTSLSRANEIAKTVPKFEIGRDFFDDTVVQGPYKTVTKQVADEAPVVPKSPEWVNANDALSEADDIMAADQISRVKDLQAQAAATRAAKEAQYAHLADNKDLDSLGVGEIPRTIMSKVDEPVYADYEKRTIQTTTEAGRPQTIEVWVPTQEAVRSGQVMEMGKVREILADKPLTREEAIPLIDEMRDPNTPMQRKAEIKARLDRKPISPERKAMVKAALANHIRAVEGWIKSGPAGYKDAAGYTALYRELYGMAPKDVARGPKAVEAAKAKMEARKNDLPDMPEPTAAELDTLDEVLPASPFEDAPSYKEITEYADLPPAERDAWFAENVGDRIPEEYVTYLSKASSAAEYDKRLADLALMNYREARDAEDVANAIANKQLLDVTEQGVPELLQHYGVKTLKQLEKAIRKDLKSLDSTERKLFGAINTPVGAKVGENTIYTGRQPWESRLATQIAEAKAAAAKNTSSEVVTSEDIIQQVIDGNDAEIVAPKIVLAPTQREVFNHAIQVAVDKNIITPNDKSLYKFVTRTGVRKTKKKIYKGKARVQDAWNKYSQYDFFKGLLNDTKNMDSEVKKILDDLSVKGNDRLMARADYQYRLLMEPLRGMDELLKAGGVFPVAGTRQFDTPFSLYESLAALPENFVKKWILTLDTKKINGNIISESRISPTQLMDVMDIGVAAMKHPENIDGLPDLLKKALLERQKTTSGKYVPNGLPAIYKKTPLVIDEIVNDIIDSLPNLYKQVQRNQALRDLWHKNQQFEGTQASLDAIAARVASPDYNLAEALKLSNEIDPLVRTVSRTKGMTPDDEFMVNAEVNAATPEFEGLNAEARAEAKYAEKTANAKDGATKTKVGVDAMRDATEQAQKITDDMGETLASLETKLDRSMVYRFIHAIFPHFGNEVIRPMYLSKASAAQTIARTYQGLIGKLSMNHTAENVGYAWKDLQAGRWSLNPEVHAAQVELNKAIGVMFSDDARYSLFNRQGLNAEELNLHFEHYKIPHNFHLEEETMHNAWRTWDTNDPLDLLSKVFAATQKTVGKKLLGDQLMLEFGSLTKKPGYIKIADRGNEILRYVDTDTYYFPREIASQMRILDEFLRIDMKPTYAGTGATALRVYDSALHAYKSGLTIYRPGHHIRNMTGDVWLSYMAGVSNPAVYRDALRVMRQMSGRYNDFDAVKALAAGDEVPMDVSNSIIAYVRINGKRTGLTAGQIYRGMFDHGVLPDYRTLEDLHIGTEGAFEMPKLFKGKVHKVAATVSQSRDHYIRLAHGIDVLKKGNFTSLEAAMEQASHTVRKWHPDGSDLTHFESKVMRRTFMFYSWIRKAVPLVLEGMTMRPGRALAYPKFMYNIAQTNGINLDSLSNPFPIDQLFPDYLTESLQGPLFQNDEGHYMGIQPGIPMLDILGDYGGNSPMSTLVSSLSPVAKIPMEMGMGQTQGAVAMDSRTGTPVFDKSDYLDKQIPNSNLFINTFGKSLTQPTESRGGAQRDFQPDTKSAWINFLGGLGLMDMSRPGVVMQGARDANKRRQ